MIELSDSDAALLRLIASPAINGVAGACAGMVLDALLSADLVTVGFVPARIVTEGSAWVEVTEGGTEWLVAHPPQLAEEEAPPLTAEEQAWLDANALAAEDAE